MRRTKLAALTCLGLFVLGGAGAAAYLYSVTGLYGFNVLLRRGGSVWGPATADDPRITPGMRLALGASPPVPTAGSVTWAEIAPGVETAEMPVLAGGSTVDKVLLTRFDPARWTSGVHNDPGGNREPADWLKATGAAFVINGSYFERTGLPSIPIVSAGALAGPDTYSASHGAFVSGPGGTTIVDLAGKSWKDVLTGARDASVSYPILIDDKGASRAEGDDRWLANRSFVGEDARGRIVFGTTEDAYLTLNRLGPFLAARAAARAEPRRRTARLPGHLGPRPRARLLRVVGDVGARRQALAAAPPLRRPALGPGHGHHRVPARFRPVGPGPRIPPCMAGA